MKPLILETHVLLYKTDDGTTRDEANMADEAICLSQNQMSQFVPRHQAASTIQSASRFRPAAAGRGAHY